VVGRGQSGAEIPAGLPAEAAQQLRQIAEQTFHTAFTEAMKPSLALAIVVLAGAAVCCLLIKEGKRGGAPAEEREPIADAVNTEVLSN
jgi:hypothetical protein